MQTAAPPVLTPKRSKRRWYLIGGFALFLLATPFAYLMVATYWLEQELEQIYREMDAEDPNWRWADLVKAMPPALPDERNAFVQLMKVGRMVKAAPLSQKWAFGYSRLATPLNARLTVADEQGLRADLAALAPKVLEEARKIKDMPEGQVAIDPLASCLDFQFDWLEMAHVARTLQYDAALHAQHGRMEQAADAGLAMVRSAHALGDVPVEFAQMVRLLIQWEAVTAIERTLAQGIADEERLETLQKALDIEANHDGMLPGLLGTRAYLQEVFLALRDGTPDGEKLIEMMQLPRGFYTLFPSMMLRHYPMRLRSMNEIVRASQRKDDEGLNAALPKPEMQPLNASKLFDLIFTPELLRAQRETKARVRCAVAALAAERFRLRFGAWPMAADELTKAGLLKDWPTDIDGQPMRLRRTATGLLVYSVGQDGIDNQGVINRDRLPTSGTDVGFELWDRQLRAILPPMKNGN